MMLMWKKMKIILGMFFSLLMLWSTSSVIYAASIPVDSLQDVECVEDDSIIMAAQVQVGWVYKGDHWEYYSSDGNMIKNRFQVISGKTYCFDANGRMVTGWYCVNGKYYFMDSSGAMAINTWIGQYYVDSNGVWVEGKVQSGWIMSGGRWWYRNADGSYPRSKWQKINGIWYLFDENGWMLTGWQRWGGDWYFLNSDGHMLTGWLTLGKTKYFLNGSGQMLTGWQTIGNDQYFFQSSGAMATNCWVSNYYINAEGIMVPNQWIQSGSRWWYRHGDGSYTRSAWEQINGKWYHFDKDGWMQTGWLLDGGKWYYLKSSGEMACNYWIGTSGVGSYYVNNDGVMIANVSSYKIERNPYTCKYSFDSSGRCTDEYVIDPLNGKTYKVEDAFWDTVYLGTDITEEDLMTAVVYAESRGDGIPGMTGTAMVILNRMYNSQFPSSVNFVIYQYKQFSVAGGNILSTLLNHMNNGSLTKEEEIYLPKAREAVQSAQEIMYDYTTNGIDRTIPDLHMPDQKKDFDCLYFMTTEAFNSSGLSAEKCGAFTYGKTTFFTNYIYE